METNYKTITSSKKNHSMRIDTNNHLFNQLSKIISEYAININQILVMKDNQ